MTASDAPACVIDGDIAGKAPAPPGIRLSGGRLTFDGRPLFDDLDVTLAAGRVTCLLGPSGVGKSSLLRLLAGLVEDAAAPPAILCDDGLPLTGRVAYMDQRDLLLPWASIRRNVQLGARLRGEPPDRARADALLAAVGLDHRADDLPATLSGGMRQRVALARTLMENRPVVLMDEPFSALDAVTRYRLQGLASRLLAGRTVLLVTHDPLEALRLGHRIHVMQGAPARLDTALEPPGPPPREPYEAELTAAAKLLMARLQDAAGAEAS
ncbi:ABC transporter ATP-binding protein [Oceanibacterium hippocampi]|uniref:Aliphatic sulfonates import ATP-binding protein SsuB n=1 Tax=Oceanibacterium hippocampi TaxID=745714 RepID=A0A1Y5TYU3_9PROT|nr:ATP-binding cassette domain-containing protein [Oceanibacterium hippocampi]SLN76960.1 Aliphatic sulfonates import ATP-binding protein SsuB [Oceanibacterium hippocampi]